jgi:hypothetical protein
MRGDLIDYVTRIRMRHLTHLHIPELVPSTDLYWYTCNLQQASILQWSSLIPFASVHPLLISSPFVVVVPRVGGRASVSRALDRVDAEDERVVDALQGDNHRNWPLAAVRQGFYNGQCPRVLLLLRPQPIAKSIVDISAEDVK